MDFYDLIIIGGGIVGLGAARDAALRGLKVLVIEKNDFGSGASSKTSKLLHGGLRYLETFDFSLVRESLRERDALLVNAKGLCAPKRFMFPLFKTTKKPSFLIKAGLSLYDLFAKNSTMPSHSSVSKKETASLYPFLKQDMLNGGFHYYDGTMRDSRILIENMLSATEAGASCLNYTKISEFLFNEGKIEGVAFIRKGVKQKAYAKAILNATGSDADSLCTLAGDDKSKVRRSKGIHLVLKEMLSDDAILLISPIDGRVFFLIPWEGMTLLGTTDTELKSFEELSITENDIDYLLKSANHYLEKPLLKSAIASTFVGVRPLVFTAGKSSYSSSRSAKIESAPSGLMTVIGGKYTTFRSIAEEVVDALSKKYFKDKSLKPCVTKTLPFSESRLCKQAEVEMAEIEAAGFHAPLILRLKNMWAHRAYMCLKEILVHPQGQERICPHHPFLIGELVYSVLHEGVLTADDWQSRRTTSIFTGECTPDCTNKINEIIISTCS